MGNPETRAVSVVTDVKRYTRKSGTSFYYSFLLLPKAKRKAIYSVYSFCRAVDDAVDEASDPGQAVQDLERWETVVEDCYKGVAECAVGEALAKTVREFRIPKQHFTELVAGVRMDITRKRYRTFEELLPYCEKVAGAVGLMCIRIFGLRGTEADQYARNLGIALQLINIARDVGSDASRGRIYLPLTDLERFRVTEDEILERRYSPRFAVMMSHHAERARSYLTRADASVFNEKRSLVFPAEGMRAIYRALLDAIEKADYDVFSQRISVGRFRRFGLALGAWLGSLYYRVLGTMRRAEPEVD